MLSAASLAAALWLGLADHAAREARIDAVEQRARTLRPQAEAALQAEARIARLAATIERAAALQRGAAPAVAVLEELARHLPDHTHLAELKLDGGHILLTGYTGQAEPLLSAIDSSTLFSGARFAAPVTRHARDGLDRVQIAVELRAQTNPPSSVAATTLVRREGP